MYLLFLELMILLARLYLEPPCFPQSILTSPTLSTISSNWVTSIAKAVSSLASSLCINWIWASKIYYKYWRFIEFYEEKILKKMNTPSPTLRRSNIVLWTMSKQGKKHCSTPWPPLVRWWPPLVKWWTIIDGK